MIRANHPPLTSRYVLLRPPPPPFINHMYELAVIGDIPWIWTGGQETPESFQRSFYHDVVAQFAIFDRRTGEAAGLISATDGNPIHGFAFMNLLLLPTHQKRVWPLEAAVLFTNYLFVKHNLRRLYGRSTGENFEQFSSGVDRYFEIEGCLKGHLILNGEEQDVYLLTLTRDRWKEVGIPLLERVTRSRAQLEAKT
jgi:RimJ/RimL family protein N-acetyltransferase